MPGDDLVFESGSQLSSINDFPAGTTFNTLTVYGHSMEGNAIALNAGLIAGCKKFNFSELRHAFIDLQGIKLNNDQAFTAPGCVYTFAGASAFISSPIDNNGKTLTLNENGDIVFSGVISGTGGMSLTGFSIVELTANNTYTGATTVDKGELLVLGSQPSSPVQVSNFDQHIGENILRGSGTVGPVSYTYDGFLAPGGLNNGTGILSINGDLSFAPTSDFARLEFDLKGSTPGTGYDQVRTAGAVNLGKAHFRLNIPTGFSPAMGETFTLIRNDSASPIQSDFSRQEGEFFSESGVPFIISYKGGDGNDVVLRVPPLWDGGGNDDNWTTAANWRGDVLPTPGDLLVFPSNAPRRVNVNTFPIDTKFAGILARGEFLWMSGNRFTLGPLGLHLQYAKINVVPEIRLTEPSQVRLEEFLDIAYLHALDLGPHKWTVETADYSWVVFLGPITGTGEIHKLGGPEGWLEFGETAQTSGNHVKVFGGDVLIASAHIDAPIFLDPAGTAPAGDIDLMGSGSIGSVVVGGARVSAGGRADGAGLLTVNGDITFSGNANIPATLVVTLGGATASNHDKLVVNGIVNLDKPELLVSLKNGYAPPAGSKFSVIVNDGTDAIQGTFPGKPEGSSFIVGGTTFSISYVGGDGNDLVLTVVNATPTPTPAPKLANISTRLRVRDGDNVLIGGMIAKGSDYKRVIIRAIGPTLTDLGVPDALSNPTLEFFSGNNLITSNDDWRNSAQAAEIENSGFAPGKEAESAIMVSLEPNQNYTAVVRGKDGQTGVGLVEAFDIDELASVRLANMSTRGFVDVDDNVMIAGLIVAPTGAVETKVLVRALGPTLGDFGVQGFLANPTLDLVGANGTVIRSNNDWKDSQQSEIQQADLAPKYDAEAALIQSLQPGAYTAVVRGNSSTTGVGLVEVYNIP
jgi:autotransporter-associated beta strand protein